MKKEDQITEAELDALINGFENHDFDVDKPSEEKNDYASISKTLDQIEENNPYLKEASHILEDYGIKPKNDENKNTKNRKKLR